MLASDVNRLVRLHRAVFPNYNSTALGGGYLKALYRTLAASQHAVGVVGEERGAAVAWVAGVTDYPRFNRALLRRCILAAPAILLSALPRRPALALRAIKYAAALVNERLRRRSTNAPQSLPTAHLLVIGVSPERQGEGIAAEVMAAFHDRLAAAGFKRCRLSTFADNAQANAAFAKAGYRLYDSSRGVNYYEIELEGR